MNLKYFKENKTQLIIGIITSSAVAAAFFFFEQYVDWFEKTNLPIVFQIIVLVLMFFTALFFFLFKSYYSRRIRSWQRRDLIRPPLSERILNAKKEIFFVGASLDSALQDYNGELCQALNNNKELKLKILFLHPESKHVSAHQDFAGWDVKATIIHTINGPLRELFNKLKEDAKFQIDVRLTFYLPRFALRVVDDWVYVNFYLYNLRAQSCPTVLFHKRHHKEISSNICESYGSLLEYGDISNRKRGKTTINPNYKVIVNGEWKGLPNINENIT